MKSRLTFITVIFISISMIYGCTPEEPNVERDQQAIQDSLEQVYQAELEEMRQDSIRQARQDSMAAQRAREREREQIAYSEDGNFVVQIEAWRSEEKAQQQAQEWIELGYDQAYVVTYGDENTGNVWYRVRIGHFDSRNMAERLQAKLDEDHDAVSWVSRTGQPLEADAMQ